MSGIVRLSNKKLPCGYSFFKSSPKIRTTIILELNKPRISNVNAGLHSNSNLLFYQNNQMDFYHSSFINIMSDILLMEYSWQNTIKMNFRLLFFPLKFSGYFQGLCLSEK